MATIGMGPAAVARLRKGAGQHKYDHGHALVLSGGVGRTGAARLAARAALRCGAGLVTLGVPGAAVIEVAAQVTAVMLRRVDDAPALAGLLADPRLNALCLGPGFGVGDRCRDAVATALGAGRAVVLDADALGSFAAEPGALFAMTREGMAVLTPHMGEFRRLFPELADLPAPEACAAAAQMAGCVVLLKGAATVVAGPEGRVAVHNAGGDRAAPWLATAGSGDVLAGMICGLMARGIAPQPAAEMAVWLHAEAARHLGPGPIAEDLPEALPAVFRAIGV